MTNRLTEEQKRVCLQNCHLFHSDSLNDPFQVLSLQLSVPRNEAKRIWYVFNFTESSWYKRQIIEYNKREIQYLIKKVKELSDGEITSRDIYEELRFNVE